MRRAFDEVENYPTDSPLVAATIALDRDDKGMAPRDGTGVLTCIARAAVPVH
jgi:hypothetical protein